MTSCISDSSKDVLLYNAMERPLHRTISISPSDSLHQIAKKVEEAVNKKPFQLTIVSNPDHLNSSAWISYKPSLSILHICGHPLQRLTDRLSPSFSVNGGDQKVWSTVFSEITVRDLGSFNQIHCTFQERSDNHHIQSQL